MKRYKNPLFFAIIIAILLGKPGAVQAQLFPTNAVSTTTASVPPPVDPQLAQGLDYNDFVSTSTGGAKPWGEIDDGYFRSYFKNFVAATNLLNNQMAWLEVKLRSPQAGKYRLACRLGVLGSPSEKVSIFINGKTAADKVVAGTGWPSPFSLEVTFSDVVLNVATLDTNDVTVRFEYTTGASVTDNNSGRNRGGVDYLAWEYADINPPIAVRMEKTPEGTTFNAGTFSEINNAVKISWPKTVETDPETGKYQLWWKKGANDWIKVSNPPSYTTPMPQDLTGLRYTCYMSKGSMGTGLNFFQLRKIVP